MRSPLAFLVVAFYPVLLQPMQLPLIGGPNEGTRQKLPVACVGPNKGHKEHLERFAMHIQGKGENPCPVQSAIVVTRVAPQLLE